MMQINYALKKTSGTRQHRHVHIVAAVDVP
jgi:hypothetical protein